MHNNHCHRATAHLQLNILLLLVVVVVVKESQVHDDRFAFD